MSNLDFKVQSISLVVVAISYFCCRLCKLYDEKLFPAGSYYNDECGVKIKKVGAFEEGEWECDVREFVTGWNIFGNPKTKSHTFNVKVKRKVSTSMNIDPLGRPTITAGSNNCSYVLPNFSKSRKTKQISSKNSDPPGETLGSGRADH